MGHAEQRRRHLSWTHKHELPYGEHCQKNMISETSERTHMEVKQRWHLGNNTENVERSSWFRAKDKHEKESSRAPGLGMDPVFGNRDQ